MMVDSELEIMLSHLKLKYNLYKIEWHIYYASQLEVVGGIRQQSS